MKINSWFAIAFCALISFGARLHADDAKGVGPPWYQLEAGEAYHSDHVLKPGESKAFKVNSAAPLIIGFKTDLNFAKVNAWKNDDLDPVHLSTADREGLGASVGAARRFNPTNGTVALSAKNNADYVVKIVIYTKPATVAK